MPASSTASACKGRLNGLLSSVCRLRSSSVVMLATVAVVVYTHNLALGVLTGVLLSGIFFAGKIAQIFRITSEIWRSKAAGSNRQMQQYPLHQVNEA